MAAAADPGSLQVITGSSDRTQGHNPKNPNRLRTMFRVETDTSDQVMLMYQMMDSPFVIRELRRRLSLQTYFNALALGKAMGSGAVVGVFFEELLHKWFEEVLPDPVSSSYKATGTGAQGVTQLKSINVYWVPSIPNYPNIDAAVVVNGVLYVFQYKKRTGHPFNADTFWQDFVSVVCGQVVFDRIHVYIVTPEYIENTLTVNFTKHYAPPGRVIPRGAANMIAISCTSSLVNITTSSLKTVQASAEAAFTFTE